MSATAVIVIAVAAVVVLGALAFMALARRSDVRGAGALSAETVRASLLNRSTSSALSNRPGGGNLRATIRPSRVSSAL